MIEPVRGGQQPLLPEADEDTMHKCMENTGLKIKIFKLSKV
jgi:hypothetical protein